MAAAPTNEERMGSAPIGQLMFQLALPAVAETALMSLTGAM